MLRKICSSSRLASTSSTALSTRNLLVSNDDVMVSSSACIVVAASSDLAFARRILSRRYLISFFFVSHSCSVIPRNLIFCKSTARFRARTPAEMRARSAELRVLPLFHGTLPVLAWLMRRLEEFVCRYPPWTVLRCDGGVLASSSSCSVSQSRRSRRRRFIVVLETLLETTNAGGLAAAVADVTAAGVDVGDFGGPGFCFAFDLDFCFGAAAAACAVFSR
mmetsp:Transcript_26898/g.75603  ORF Transcript_26898/g.75603 Transcript_26898/m.75603 type:complete len:220 (+) Transcript_26898:748-1407(+)